LLFDIENTSKLILHNSVGIEFVKQLLFNFNISNVVNNPKSSGIDPLIQFKFKYNPYNWVIDSSLGTVPNSALLFK
jgi:hypothetical protein